VIQVRPVALDGGIAIGVMVELPKARNLTISTAKGFIAGGLLDVTILDALHPERRVVAARVTGVREIDHLLGAKVRDCTTVALELGVRPGMTGREALQLML